MKSLARTTGLVGSALAALVLLAAPAVAGPPRAPRASRATIVANVDPALLAAPAPLSAPLVFAHGNLGIPRVITWANTAGTSGLAWGTTAAIVAGNAYVTYNGTDMVLNVPTGDGFSFLVNNVEVGGLPTAGGFETNVIQILSGTTLTINDAAGNAGPVFTDVGTVIDQLNDGKIESLEGGGTRRVGMFFGGSNDIAIGSVSDHIAEFVQFNGAGLCLQFTTTAAFTIGEGCGGSNGNGTFNSANLNALGIGLAPTANNEIQFASLVPMIQIANTGTLTIQDDAGNGLASFIDNGTDGTFRTNFINPFTLNGNLLFEDHGGSDLFLITDNGTTGSATIYGGSLFFTDASVALAESGTNDLDLTTDGAVSVTLSGGATPTLTFAGSTSLVGSVMRLQNATDTHTLGWNATGENVIRSSVASGGSANRIGSSYDFTAGVLVSIEDAMPTTDAAGTRVASILFDGGYFFGPDTSVGIAESGTNDMSLTADGTVEIIITGTESTLGGNINFSNADSRIRSDDSLILETVAGADYAVFSTTAGLSISFGTGTGTATVGGALYVNSTAVGNVGAGPDVLQTYDLPANSLVAASRGVRVSVSGTAANTVNAKTLTCYAGSQAVLTHAMTTSLGIQWRVEFTVLRTGASTQDLKAEYRGNSGAANSFEWEIERGTATQTETAAITLKCEATTVTDTNDLVSEDFIVRAI